MLSENVLSDSPTLFWYMFFLSFSFCSLLSDYPSSLSNAYLNLHQSLSASLCLCRLRGEVNRQQPKSEICRIHPSAFSLPADVNFRALSNGTETFAQDLPSILSSQIALTVLLLHSPTDAPDTSGIEFQKAKVQVDRAQCASLLIKRATQQCPIHF